MHDPRFLLAASVLAAAMCSTGAARADETAKKACVDSHLEGQRSRDGGKLKDARQQFLMCSVETCPAPLRKDCLQWLAEIDSAMPTVSIRARSDGRDTADVKVLVDGESAADHLTGMPISVDPGEHVLRFVHVDGRTREERVVLTAGEKGRPVIVDFSGSGPTPPVEPIAPPQDTGSSTPASVYVLGGVGIVALGSFAVFGVKALTQGNDLKGSCAPSCSKSDSDAMHRDALVADVSLAVGVVALGAATWILLTHRPAPSALVVAPTKQGGVVGWQGRF